MNLENESIEITPDQNFWVGLKECYRYRHLLYFFIVRDAQSIYRQTILGFVWAFFGPIFTMLLYTSIFGYIVKIASEGMPYPVFVFSALVAWNYFSFCVTSGVNSLLGNSAILTKVYFPRILLPLVGVFVGLINFSISLFAFFILCGIYKIPISSNIFWTPLFILLSIIFSLGISFFLAPLNAWFRDVAQLTPYLLTFGLYVTPVIYPLYLVGGWYQKILELNPMTQVVMGVRWSLTGVGESPFNESLALSAAIACIIFLFGIVFFQKLEKTIADLI